MDILELVVGISLFVADKSIIFLNTSTWQFKNNT